MCGLFYLTLLIMNIILFDKNRVNFYPLSFTRPISHFRIGILTIKEKWEQYYGSVSVKTEDYLSEKFPLNIKKDNIWIDASILPSEALVTELNSLRSGEALAKDGEIFAFRNTKFETNKLNIIGSNSFSNCLNNLCDIFTLNGQEISHDFDRMSLLKRTESNKKLDNITLSNVKIGDYPIWIEDGAKLQHCILNATEGPIYIGKDAEIMEGSLIRGPFAMLNNSVLKMGAKIYGATTIGPYCKVGGEVNNSVFFGYSSKSHDGFLGNSVVGEWCNLGADTNSSNLKNNYAEVKLWSYKKRSFIGTSLQFCGLIMGDHSKSAINTMFNTGTIVGVSANIFGSGFSRTFIPSFSWGGASGFSLYKLSKSFEVAERVLARRSVKFCRLEKDILTHVYDMTKCYRNE